MSIDTMHLPVGDLSVSLANLRYWLEPWFKALDMEFETISNVLQHVHAIMLRIELREVMDSVSLAFNPVQPRARAAMSRCTVRYCQRAKAHYGKHFLVARWQDNRAYGAKIWNNLTSAEDCPLVRWV